MSTCGIDYGQPSFRALPFEALTSTRTQGRRINKNLYPFIDEHYNEDLGDLYDIFTISGVFTGPSARDQYTAAQRLWKEKGSGVLFEPTGNLRHNVQVERIDWQFEAFTINYIPFTLTLVEASGGPYPQTDQNISGRVGSIIDTFIEQSSQYYINIMQPLNQFQSVLDGFSAAGGFVFNTARQTVSGLGYPNVANAILKQTPSATSHTQTVDAVTVMFEAAAENDTATTFFRQSSEVRVQGNIAEQTQGHLFALIALAYYFDNISTGTTVDELEKFITRAEDLKVDVASDDMRVQLNTLIMTAGSLENIAQFSSLDGPKHALVASYHLYGDISRASELLRNSGGVSGAELDPVRFTE